MPPAARISDMHVCPMFDGPKPHFGGPITVGFPMVMIGGMPAARMGDLATCVGPPDSIAIGITCHPIEDSFKLHPVDPGFCCGKCANSPITEPPQDAIPS